jgi:hypothetical protein
MGSSDEDDDSWGVPARPSHLPIVRDQVYRLRHLRDQDRNGYPLHQSLLLRHRLHLGLDVYRQQ